MGEERFKVLDFLTCIADVYNISMYYASKETLKEEQMWNNRCDSLLSWYRIQPGADSAHVSSLAAISAAPVAMPRLPTSIRTMTV